MNYIDGEYQLFLNEIGHWIKIEGSSNKTVPLVILHGGPGGNHYVFERTAGPKLAKERTVIYYEQRGCGRSDTPHSEDVWALADSELVDRFLFEDLKLAKYNRRLWENSGLSNTGKMMKALQGNPPSTPLEKRLNRIKHPTLILTGAHDRNTGLKMSNIMKQELPNSKLEIFKKSAHFPDIEEESKFVAKTLKFLR